MDLGRYTTDRGQTMDVDDMEDSHLLNAIAHHRKQVHTLRDLLANVFTDPRSKEYRNLTCRLHRLEDTVLILGTELGSRKFIYEREGSSNVTEFQPTIRKGE